MQKMTHGVVYKAKKSIYDCPYENIFQLFLGLENNAVTKNIK